MNSETGNTSGHGPSTEIPAEVKRWSWGGFCLSWIWGVFNGTFIALLSLIPLVNLVMAFVLGAKGNEWAWRNKQWQSIEHFHQVQKNWAIAGLVIVLGATTMGIGIAVVSTLVIVGVGSEMSKVVKDTPAMKRSMAMLRSDPKVSEMLGDNIDFGFGFGGNFSINNDSGKMDVSIPVKGSKGEGKLYIKGIKEAGVWNFSMIKFGMKDSNERIDLLTAGQSGDAEQ